MGKYSSLIKYATYRVSWVGVSCEEGERNVAIVPVAEPMGHAARKPLLLECAMPVFSIRVVIMILIT